MEFSILEMSTKILDMCAGWTTIQKGDSFVYLDGNDSTEVDINERNVLAENNCMISFNVKTNKAFVRKSDTVPFGYGCRKLRHHLVVYEYLTWQTLWNRTLREKRHTRGLIRMKSYLKCS